MKPTTQREIEEKLRSPQAPEPPLELLERILEEIPDEITVQPPSRFRSRRLQLLAASLLVAVIGGSLAWQRLREQPRPLVVEAPELPAVGEASDSADLQPRMETPEAANEVAPLTDRVVLNQVRFKQPERKKEKLESRPSSLSKATEENEAFAMVGGEKDAVSRDDRVAGTLSDAAASAAPPLASANRPPAASRGLLLNEARQRRVKSGTEQIVVSQTGSTGGTAEPNDQAFGDMFFRSSGVNPFVDTEDDALSTFGLDVDTGSYTVARGYLDRGHLPPAEAIRVEEFINFFDYGDPAPRRGDFSLTAEGAASPFGEGDRYYLVRFGVQGRVVDARDRKPAVLTFVVDVSGSMQREDRLELVKDSLHLLLDQLDEGDEVGLVVYGSRGEVLLEPTGDHRRIRSAIDRLRPGGSTNAEEGLVLGYEMASRYFRRSAINRIILCSDGVANVGRTGPDSILERVRQEAERGIELSTVGFGMGNYNDVLMEQLADGGDGQYAYVDTIDEARRVFVENLTGTLQTIAGDAKAQVKFNPEVVSRYRLLGYENRDIADQRFRDDSVDAGEIGAGHSVTALYEIKLRERAERRGRSRAPLATLHLRWRSKASGRVEETTLEIRERDLKRRWRDSSRALQQAGLVAEFAEILKGSYWAKSGDLGEVSRQVNRLAREDPRDAELQELRDLIEKARRLTPETDDRWEE